MHNNAPYCSYVPAERLQNKLICIYHNSACEDQNSSTVAYAEVIKKYQRNANCNTDIGIIPVPKNNYYTLNRCCSNDFIDCVEEAQKMRSGQQLDDLYSQNNHIAQQLSEFEIFININKKNVETVAYSLEQHVKNQSMNIGMLDDIINIKTLNNHILSLLPCINNGIKIVSNILRHSLQNNNDFEREHFFSEHLSTLKEHINRYRELEGNVKMSYSSSKKSIKNCHITKTLLSFIEFLDDNQPYEQRIIDNYFKFSNSFIRQNNSFSLERFANNVLDGFKQIVMNLLGNYFNLFSR